jgi:hypothetical protein
LRVTRLPPRVLRFLLLGLLLATANTFASTLAATQFLSVVGAEGLPLYYVFFAVVSIPVSIVLARAIDRVPRIPLLIALAAVVGTAALAGSLAAEGGEAGTKAVYLGVAVFEQLSYSVFYVLLADHFTALEVNRHSGLVSTAMAGGGLLGGGLVWAGSFLAPPQALLLAVPLLVLPAAAAALWIRRVDAPAGEGGDDEAEESLAESLRSVPRIIARHPIALFIAAGVLLNQITQCVSEYQAFSVYEATFPDEQDLAAFLGLMNAGLNLVGLAFAALATTPLIRRFGIGGLNLFFPAVTLLAFVWLSVDFALPAAIFGHIVYDAMANAVDQPVMTGNYNAVPNRFVARIRVVADGMVYPMALAGAGAILMVAQLRLDPLGISLLGAVLGVLFVAVGFGLRRHYRRGMLGLLREGAVELGAAAERIGTLPDDQIGEIRAMLRSPDPEAQRLGLELVARTDVARFLGDVAPALPRADPAVRRRLAERVRRSLDPDVLSAVRDLSRAPDPALRALAVDVLGTAGGSGDAELAAWLADPDPEVAALAAVGFAMRTGDVGLMARPLAEATPPIRLAMVHACASASPSAALPVLAAFVGDRDPAVRVAALDAARGRVEGGRAGAVPVGWAASAIDADDPAVRAAGLRLAAACCDPDGTERLVRACADGHQAVRAAAVDGLAVVGQAAVPAILAAIGAAGAAPSPTLLEALARAGGPRAEAVVADHLGTAAFDPIQRRRQWRRALVGDARHAGLVLALDDADARAVETVMRVVATLGYQRTMALVRTALATGDERTRANAVEALMSVRRRRLVAPLLAVLDPDGTGGGRTDPAAAVAAASADADPWVRAGAAHAAGRPEGEIMNRLLFLKTVPLFAGLTLDDLVSVDAALEHETYLAGETVIAEGTQGDKLFLLLDGEAAVTAGGRPITALSAGACFGEMAMFDLAPRSATVTATVDCALLSMRRDRFRSLVAQRPQVLMEICRVFGDRLRATNQLVVGTLTSDREARPSAARASSPG